MFDKGNDPPPPPDYSQIANASQHSADLAYQTSQDQLAWAREQYAQNKEVTDKVVDDYLNTSNTNQATAAKDRARYEQIYQPLEDKLAADANDYGSDSRHELERGRATANVSQQFDAARQSATRDLEAFGINPSATRYAALDLGMRTQKAAAAAAAANQADQQVDATGRALRSEAINVGRGYPGQIAGQYGTALQAGSGAVNSNLATTASGANTIGTGTTWAGTGNNALGTWGNTLNTGYNNQMAYYKAQQDQNSGLGQILGVAAGAGLKTFGPGGPVSLFAAEGGEIPPAGALPIEATPGGVVHAAQSPSHGVEVDDVPARLTAGEFVLPKDVASWYGEEKLQKFIQKAREDKAGAKAKPRVGNAPAQRPTFQSSPRSAVNLAA